MEEESQKPHRVSRKLEQSGSHWSKGADEEPRARCSGKRCRSWAAAAIADCVALCCCPCVVVNLLGLAFVKVPWMIGRKCIGRGGRRKKMKREDRFHQQENHHRRSAEMVSGGCCGGADGDGDDHRFVVERDGSLTKEEEDKTASLKGEEETRVEAERVWLELYQFGHLGFGRVSFTQ